MKWSLVLIFFLQTIVEIYANTLTITAQSSASTVDITQNQTNLNIATLSLGVTGSASSPISYQVTATSLNGGLKNSTAISKGASATSATLAYTLSFSQTGGGGSNPVATPNSFTVNSTSEQTLFNVTDNKNGGGKSVNGNIQFTRTGTAAASLYSGTYTDTLTIKTIRLSDNNTVTRTFNLSTSVVADTITISVTPTAVASNLDLKNSQSQLTVGTVSITANCQNGYSITLSSSNEGKLVNTAVGGAPLSNEKINYTLYYLGSQVPATQSGTVIATSNNATLLTNTTLLGNLGISYTGVEPSVMRAGTYQDNLTITLQSQ